VLLRNLPWTDHCIERLILTDLSRNAHPSTAPTRRGSGYPKALSFALSGRARH